MRGLLGGVLATLLVTSSVSIGAIVTPGIGVADSLEDGYALVPGGTYNGAAFVESVETDGDDRREVLAYDGRTPVVYGPGLEVQQSPVDATRGIADVSARLDVDGDGRGELVVADHDRVRIVEGDTGLTLSQKPLDVLAVRGIEIVQAGEAPQIVLLTVDGGSLADGYQGRIVAFSVSDLEVRWESRFNGAPYSWDVQPEGAMVGAWSPEPDTPDFRVHLVEEPGGPSWTHEPKEYALPYGFSGFDHVRTVGWLGAKKVFWLDGDRALVVAWASNGTIVSQTPLPGSHTPYPIDSSFATGVAADVDLDGTTDVVVGEGNFFFNSEHRNRVSGYLSVIDGESSQIRSVTKLDGFPRHVAVGNVSGGDTPEVYAATITGEPIAQTNPWIVGSSSSQLPGRVWAPIGVSVTEARVAAFDADTLAPRWVRSSTSGGYLGWQHVTHRGLALAEVGPGGEPALVVEKTWLGALETLDPGDGSLMTRVERPGGVFDAARGPCGLQASHLTGHVTLGGQTRARLPSVPLQLAPRGDCGAYAFTPSDLFRLTPTGQRAWRLPLTAPGTDLVTVDGDGVLLTADGLVQRIDEGGQPLWVQALGHPRLENRQGAVSTPAGLAVTTCVEWRPSVSTPGAVDPPARLYPWRRAPATPVPPLQPVPPSTVSMLDPSTGEVEWQTQVPLCPWDPVKLENGNVVVASGDQVFAFDPETGDTVWTLEPGPRTLDSWALQDGSVAVLSWQGEQLFVTTIEADGSEVVNHELPYPPTFWETILGVTRWDGETAVFMTDGEASRMFTLSGEAIGRPGMVQTTSWVGWWGASEVPGYNRYGGCSVQDQGLLCWGRAGVGSLLHVVPDRSSPQVRIQDTSTRSQAGQETISVTGSVQEDVRVAFGLIEARRGEERLQSPLNVTVQGTFQGSLSLPEEGAWNVTVEVHDTAGHVSSSSRSVQVGEG